ncbi:hypothetical protein DASC09_029750 [Saccharomycopsis crataegensis]|uniref:C2 NT-type domain-containing protein n=1 Tax=Saccharomycopsis crataegensis TaxID=43959 RepID=A0AAV5QL17_9ASCO|nr:hypothetical protein DASC09_029750 [Saccharomycopsis crataegensis]
MLSNLSSKKSRKTRFDLSFSVMDLTNLPQLTGLCYVKWAVKDSASHPISKPLSTSSSAIPSSGFLSTSGIRSASSTLEKSSRGFTSSADPSTGDSSYNSSIFGNSFKGTTVPKTIDNHKVKFDISQKVPAVKFETNRKIRNRFIQLEDRFLILDIYVEANTTTDNSAVGEGKSQEIVHNQEKKTFLGQVKINLVDYIFKNFDCDKLSFSHSNNLSIDKYLLQESKINSILSVAIKLELVKGHYQDFSNRDFIKNGVYESSVPANNTLSANDGAHLKKTMSKNSSIQDETSDYLASNWSHHGDNISSMKSERGKTGSKFSEGLSISEKASKHGSSNSISKSMLHDEFENTINIGENSNINNVDIITKLYYKTFKVPWDERPNEFNPKECIDDIFVGGNGWKRTVDGVNLIDLDYTDLSNNQVAENNNRNHNGNKARPYFSPPLETDERKNMDNRQNSTDDHCRLKTPKFTTPNLSIPRIFLSNHNDSPQLGGITSPDVEYITPLNPKLRKMKDGSSTSTRIKR